MMLCSVASTMCASSRNVDMPPRSVSRVARCARSFTNMNTRPIQKSTRNTTAKYPHASYKTTVPNCWQVISKYHIRHTPPSKDSDCISVGWKIRDCFKAPASSERTHTNSGARCCTKRCSPCGDNACAGFAGISWLGVKPRLRAK